MDSLLRIQHKITSCPIPPPQTYYPPPNQQNHIVAGYDGQAKSCPYNVYNRL